MIIIINDVFMCVCGGVGGGGGVGVVLLFLVWLNGNNKFLLIESRDFYSSKYDPYNNLFVTTDKTPIFH